MLVFNFKFLGGLSVNRFRRVTATLAVCIAAAFVSSPSSATVIDFENANNLNSFAFNGANLGDGFSMPGFSNSTYAGGAFSRLASNSLNGQPDPIPSAYAGENFGTNFRSRTGAIVSASPIDVQSLWAHADYRFGASNTVRFQGLDGLGGNVLYTKDVDLETSWQQILFLNWTGVSVLTWDPLGTAANVGIDEVAYALTPVNVVPLPAGLPLLVGGLGLLGWLGRRGKPSKA